MLFGFNTSYFVGDQKPATTISPYKYLGTQVLMTILHVSWNQLELTAYVPSTPTQKLYNNSLGVVLCV